MHGCVLLFAAGGSNEQTVLVYSWWTEPGSSHIRRSQECTLYHIAIESVCADSDRLIASVSHRRTDSCATSFGPILSKSLGRKRLRNSSYTTTSEVAPISSPTQPRVTFSRRTTCCPSFARTKRKTLGTGCIAKLGARDFQVS